MANIEDITERWLPIPGWGEDYEVSNLGAVRSVARVIRVGGNGGGRDWAQRTMAYHLDRNGYARVRIRRNGKRVPVHVHRLVAFAFIGIPTHGLQVNHRNGVKIDNRADNLEWVTPMRNIRHSIELGLKRVARGSRHAFAKLTDDDVRWVRIVCPALMTGRAAAKALGVDPMTISEARRGVTWRHVQPGVPPPVR